jgi:hypothetical protein
MGVVSRRAFHAPTQRSAAHVSCHHWLVICVVEEWDRNHQLYEESAEALVRCCASV